MLHDKSDIRTKRKGLPKFVATARKLRDTLVTSCSITNQTMDIKRYCRGSR